MSGYGYYLKQEESMSEEVKPLTKCGCCDKTMIRGAQMIISNAYGEWCSDACFNKSEAEGFKDISTLLNDLRARDVTIADLQARLAAATIDIATLEEAVDERDSAEEAMSQAYYVVTGKSPEWSNLFGYEQANEEIADVVAVLKQVAKTATIDVAAWDGMAKDLKRTQQLLELYRTLANAYRSIPDLDHHDAYSENDRRNELTGMNTSPQYRVEKAEAEIEKAELERMDQP